MARAPESGFSPFLCSLTCAWHVLHRPCSTAQPRGEGQCIYTALAATYHAGWRQLLSCACGTALAFTRDRPHSLMSQMDPQGNFDICTRAGQRLLHALTRGCHRQQMGDEHRGTHFKAVAAVGVPVEVRRRLEDVAHGAGLLDGRLQHLALLVHPDLARLAPTLRDSSMGCRFLLRGLVLAVPVLIIDGLTQSDDQGAFRQTPKHAKPCKCTWRHLSVALHNKGSSQAVDRLDPKTYILM